MIAPISRVVIVGGGTAGWMTAAYLAANLEHSVHITVVDTDAVPTIGVGEATVPSLRRFFEDIRLNESDWMSRCNASFKAAVKFVNWRRPLSSGVEWFYHPFGILPSCDGISLSQYWAAQSTSGSAGPFDYACFRQPPFMDAKLSPRDSNGQPAAMYAWHFDATHFAAYLRSVSVERDHVVHVKDEVVECVLDERGYIAALLTRDGRRMVGDLFVDCTGMKGLLINRTMGEPFRDCSDFLPCDSAVATTLAHDDIRMGVEPYTSAIAMSSGWAWKIPVFGRFGTGYVYSTKYLSDEDAAAELCHLWGLERDRATLTLVRFRVGRNQRSWVKNCVSIGLASCFLDPLESTGIYFIHGAIALLVRYWPDKDIDEINVSAFNKGIGKMVDESRDFVCAHYVGSPRRDSPFWRAVVDLRVSDDLEDKLRLFRAGLPVAAAGSFWTHGSYYAILAGLGGATKVPVLVSHRPDARSRAGDMFEEIKRQQLSLVARLPPMHDVLRKIHEGSTGIQPS